MRKNLGCLGVSMWLDIPSLTTGSQFYPSSKSH